MQDTNPDPGDHTHIVIGRFVKDNGEFVEVEGELIYPLEKEQFTWNRMAAIGGCNQYPEMEHCHFNGAMDVKYENGKFEWHEIGPAHSQEEIDKQLSGELESREPAYKYVDWTNYFPEPHGEFETYYLKITRYTSELPEPLECPELP